MGRYDIRDREKRFWPLVNKTDTCWVWTGTISTAGYGRFCGKPAHRYSYELVKGRIPPGLVLCHDCDNKRCVNPDHLWPGTSAENLEDYRAKFVQRQRTDHENLYAELCVEVSRLRRRVKHLERTAERSEQRKGREKTLEAQLARAQERVEALEEVQDAAIQALGVMRYYADQPGTPPDYQFCYHRLRRMFGLE